MVPIYRGDMPRTPKPQPPEPIIYHFTAADAEEDYNERFNNKPENVLPLACALYDAINEHFGRMESDAESDALGGKLLELKGPSWNEDGSLDLQTEACRRNLDVDLLHFEAAWKAGKRFGDCSLELRTGKHDKLEGVFKGNGETFGEWDAFVSFKAEPNASNGVHDLDRGDILECGSDGHKATLVRILKGTKAAGTAEGGKRQSCFVALLCDASGWLYATLPNVEWADFEEDEAALAAIESRLDHFVPKSVTAAIRAAGRFTIKKKAAPKAKAVLVSLSAAGGSGATTKRKEPSSWGTALAAPPEPKRAIGGSRFTCDVSEEEEEEDEEEEENEESDSSSSVDSSSDSSS